MARIRLLVASNGQGEDTIGADVAAAIVERCPTSPHLEAWPMVGDGRAYRRRGIPIVGPGNHLPSEGFGTLSLGAFLRDLRHGWLRVHLRQARAAAALRDQYDAVVAVGDIVPLFVGWASGAPFSLVGCAHSAFYGRGSGYPFLEQWLLRRAACCYPRDLPTSHALQRAGIVARYLGNPMMDAVDPATDDMTRDRTLTACLPGSRNDRVHNAACLLRMIAGEHERYTAAGLRRFAFAVPAAFDVDELQTRVLETGARSEWRKVSPLPDEFGARCVLAHGAIRAVIAPGALREVLRRSWMAIGLAGTANEQAVGAGIPLVTFATDGAQGAAYLRMKMPYFGESAVEVPPDAAALAAAVIGIARDPARHAAMAAAGRARMGEPGATAAIATDIVQRLVGPIKA